MALNYVDAGCSAVGHAAATFNISGSNNQFSISIDGGAAQVFALTTGATRTVANIITDLAGLTGATVDDVNVNGANYLRIKTTTNNGNTSTILVNAPANSAHTTLGFLNTTYKGGERVRSTFTGDTKQILVTGIETALLTAGWITISGSGTLDLKMQSAMSQTPQNLRMRIRIRDAGGTNCVVVTALNVTETRAGTSSTTAGGQLLFAAGKPYVVIGNKYQAFIFAPGGPMPREYVGFGVPFLPTHLSGGTIYECIWLNSNASSDTDTTLRGSFRSTVGGWGGLQGVNNGAGNSTFITNNNGWEISSALGNTTSGGIGTFSLYTLGGNIAISTGLSWCRWMDLSGFISDPVAMWGLTARTDEALGRGILWDCFISSEAFSCDTTITGFDSNNWFNLTHLMTGNNSTSMIRGSVWITIP